VGVVDGDGRASHPTSGGGSRKLINGMLNLWPAGNFGTDKPEQRHSHARMWVRAHPGDNGYAHQVEDVVTLIDLNAMDVVAVEDHRFVSVPAESGNYTLDAVAFCAPTWYRLRSTSRRGRASGSRAMRPAGRVALPGSASAIGRG
jgi:Cu2+-containing amine oxidase